MAPRVRRAGVTGRRTTSRQATSVPSAPPPPPAVQHAYAYEWKGLKKGEPCDVLLESGNRKSGSARPMWLFIAHVTTSTGAEYVQVLEQKKPNTAPRYSKSGNQTAGPGPRLIRSFPTERVVPLTKARREAVLRKLNLTGSDEGDA